MLVIKWDILKQRRAASLHQCV